jgi:hypothetical protein
MRIAIYVLVVSNLLNMSFLELDATNDILEK